MIPPFGGQFFHTAVYGIVPGLFQLFVKRGSKSGFYGKDGKQ
jgi:hypothetical protein